MIVSGDIRETRQTTESHAVLSRSDDNRQDGSAGQHKDDISDIKINHRSKATWICKCRIRVHFISLSSSGNCAPFSSKWCLSGLSYFFWSVILLPIYYLVRLFLWSEGIRLLWHHLQLTGCSSLYTVNLCQEICYTDIGNQYWKCNACCFGDKLLFKWAQKASRYTRMREPKSCSLL